MTQAHEVAKLCHSIDHNKNGVLALRLWETIDKVHGDIMEGVGGYGQGLQEACRSNCFDLMSEACITIADMSPDLSL